MVTETKRGERELDRLIFFSDAVFAIVMTLLVLEIRVPEVPPSLAAADVPIKVLALGPKFFSYVLSFLVIGTYWIAHHQTFRYVESYDRRLLWLNLLFLLSISFIPFPTGLLGGYGELRFTVIFYAASVGLARLLLALEWLYIIKGPIRTSDDLDRRLARFHLVRSLTIPAVFVVSIGISFLNAWCEFGGHHPSKSAKANRGRPSCPLSQIEKLCSATLAARRARKP